MSRAAHDRALRQARTRQAGLPSYAGAASAHHGELLELADAYRLAGQATPAPSGGALLVRLRRACGSTLIRAGTKLKGAVEVPAPAERVPSG
jgi:hypothetical protein